MDGELKVQQKTVRESEMEKFITHSPGGGS